MEATRDTSRKWWLFKAFTRLPESQSSQEENFSQMVELSEPFHRASEWGISLFELYSLKPQWRYFLFQVTLEKFSIPTSVSRLASTAFLQCQSSVGILWRWFRKWPRRRELALICHRLTTSSTCSYEKIFLQCFLSLESWMTLKLGAICLRRHAISMRHTSSGAKRWTLDSRH